MDRFSKIIKLFLVFLKVGSFTFGGGMAMLPLIQKEVCENNKWISEEEMLDIFAITQSVPGVIAINSAVFIGKKVGGLAGAIAAAFGVTIPAFLAIIVVIETLSQFKDSIYVTKIFGGIKAASAALILLSAIKLGKSSFKDVSSIIVAAVSFLIIIVLNVNAAWAIVLGGAFGYIQYLYSKKGESKC